MNKKAWAAKLKKCAGGVDLGGQLAGHQDRRRPDPADLPLPLIAAVPCRLAAWC
jgi:hypothetical protein